MRALRAAGSCYHSQVWLADKLMMMVEPSQGVCACCVRPLRAHDCVSVCVFPGAKNLSMAAEIVDIPGIPPDSKLPVKRQQRGRHSAKVIHSKTAIL